MALILCLYVYGCALLESCVYVLLRFLLELFLTYLCPLSLDQNVAPVMVNKFVKFDENSLNFVR